MNKLLIIGASGHGKVIAEIAELSNNWDEIAFVDDDTSKKIGSYKILGSSEYLSEYLHEYSSAFVAIGNNNIRMSFIEILLKLGFSIPALIHPTSIISKTVKIGYGTVIMAGAVINPDCTIGNGCIVNTGCTIDHDCVINNGVHISPGAHLAGTVNVGNGSWICLGANIVNNILIGTDSIVAAGSTVIKHVPDSVMVAGSPAIIKKSLVKR